LDFPFFTLEYRDGIFERRIPPDAEDSGGGLFRWKESLWQLPGRGETAALAGPIIKGRPLLSLLNRGPNPLIKEGIRLAGDGERLMELRLSGSVPVPGEAGTGPLTIELRRVLPPASGDWLPLEGLPRHRLYRQVIYEIIDDETLEELAANFGGGLNREIFILRGAAIPRFAEERARLIFQFGDTRLRDLLAEDSVFIKPQGLSLVLRAFREKGPGPDTVWAAPLLRYGERRYDAREVSLRMDRDYILLENQWVRREDLLAAGLFPLEFYAGGRPIEKIKLKPEELLRGGAKRFAGLFSDLETGAGNWIEKGDRKTIFHSHLDFLRFRGLSGGVVHTNRREQAAFLCSWLLRLAAEDGPGNTLVLVEKRYYELYLPPFLPELEAARITLPGRVQKNGAPPVRAAFYGDFIPGPAEPLLADILVLVEPEETPGSGRTLAIPRNGNAGITLGIFSGQTAHGEAAAQTRAFLGIREAGTERYLIRDTARALSLPKFEFPPVENLVPAGGSPCAYRVLK
jgi:hypothetical protein